MDCKRNEGRKMKKKNMFIIISLLLLIVSMMYVVLIKTVDVSEIGPNDYAVG